MSVKQNKNGINDSSVPKMSQQTKHERQTKKELCVLWDNLPITPQEEFLQNHQNHKLVNTEEYWLCRICAERMYKQ